MGEWRLESHKLYAIGLYWIEDYYNLLELVILKIVHKLEPCNRMSCTKNFVQKGTLNIIKIFLYMRDKNVYSKSIITANLMNFDEPPTWVYIEQTEGLKLLAWNDQIMALANLASKY